LKLRPFTLDVLNDLETISIITQIVTIYCGIFFISDVSTIIDNSGSITTTMKELIADSGILLNEAAKLALIVLMIVANFVFFIIWASKFYFEVRNQLILKFPKIFTLVFLKGDKERY